MMGTIHTRPVQLVRLLARSLDLRKGPLRKSRPWVSYYLDTTAGVFEVSLMGEDSTLQKVDSIDVSKAGVCCVFNHLAINRICCTYSGLVIELDDESALELEVSYSPFTNETMPSYTHHSADEYSSWKIEMRDCRVLSMDVL